MGRHKKNDSKAGRDFSDNEMKQQEFDLDSAFKPFVLEHTREEVKRTVDYVSIDGRKFHLSSLYQLLIEIEEDLGIYFPAAQYGHKDPEFDWFKSHEILKSPGNSRWGISASKGPKFKIFFEQIKELYHESLRQTQEK
jgi:hypothetical protein